MSDKVKYHSKIVGVSFEGRQDIIAQMTDKSQLRVRREPDNKFDPKAVAVDTLLGEEWRPIGYIAKDKNSDIAAALDAGNDVEVKLADITGGGDKSYGVNIELEYEKAAEVEKVEVPMDPLDSLAMAISNAVAGQFDITVSAKLRNVERYHSQLLGRSVEVVNNNGHLSIPGFTGGSSFSEKFYQEFDDSSADRVASTYGVDASEVSAMWGLGADASNSFGNAVHFALENYYKNRKLGEKIQGKAKHNPAISKNPFIRHIVEKFIELMPEQERVLTEQFVWLIDKELCGSIDRLRIVDPEKKIVRIQDYKTNGNIHKKEYQRTTSPFYELTQGDNPVLGKTKLDRYWFQLSFYAYILEQYGYTVEGLDIFWLNPEKIITGENPWEIYSHEVIDIEKGLS